ncbi:MAG: ATP-binding protein [Myxococcota bacterium]|nr:ATP-binding protein [Myxococcota bacterium]
MSDPSRTRPVPADPASRLIAQLNEQLDGPEPDVASALCTLGRLEPIVGLLRDSTLHGFGEFERRVGELSLLRKVGELFASRFEVRSLGEGLLEVVEAAVPFRYASLILEGRDREPELMASRGEPLVAEACHRLSEAIGSCFEASEVTRFELADGTQGHVTPLVSQHQLLGVLAVVKEGPARPDATSENAEDLARTLGVLSDFVAVAIRHAHLVREQARHTRNLESLVEERTREVNEARAALSRQERVAAMGKLAASIAHEVNNPLSFLLSNLVRAQEYTRELSRTLPGLLSVVESASHLPGSDDPRIERTRELALSASAESRMSLLAEEFGSLLGEAWDGADRIRHVGDELRRFAQGVAGTPERADVPRMIETALHIVRAEAKQDIGFETRFAVVPEIHCQRYQITQVLLNLLQNAVEAVGPGGAVRIACREDAGFVEVEISDDGPGIEAEDMARIFEPFYSTKREGSGLGLSIGRDIAVAHRGSLEASSGPEGSTFKLRLPVRSG